MKKEMPLYLLFFILLAIVIPNVLALPLLAFPGNAEYVAPNIDWGNIWNFLKDFFTGNWITDLDTLVAFMRILLFVLLTAIIYSVSGTIGVGWLNNNRLRIIISVIFSLMAVLFTPPNYFILFGAQFSMILTGLMSLVVVFLMIKTYNWLGTMATPPISLSTRFFRIAILFIVWMSLNALFGSIMGTCSILGGVC